jgi:sialidase-1
MKIKLLLLIILCPALLGAKVINTEVSQMKLPVLKRNDVNHLLQMKVTTDEFDIFNSVKISLDGTTDLNDIESISLYTSWKSEKFKSRTYLIAESKVIENTIQFKNNYTLLKGDNYLWITCKLKSSADIKNKLVVKLLKLNVNSKVVSTSNVSTIEALKLGIALRKHYDDGVHTYRIPGLATSNKGTLLAVYDIRRRTGTDLQEDIDVGLSRSIDGGTTWEPMRVIMDMGEAGGLPQDQNGIGDPSILVDRTTGTIWVAAIWQQGIPYQRNWWGSKQGLGTETSQFILVKSQDDGKTWSKPINITKQIKQPEWNLLLQGPGKGITMKNGTIVFPAQFKDEKAVPHSCMIYSKDNGNNWEISSPVKAQTTEAQLIELDNGEIMINCRNNHARNKKGVGRVIATTSDMGKTWKEHMTSIVGLEESTCMASIDKNSYGKYGKLVFFSNPNVPSGRYNMTLQVSKDDAKTWEKQKLLLDQGNGRGYSCITKINDNEIGILYEGSGADLIFQIVKLDEIVK